MVTNVVAGSSDEESWKILGVMPVGEFTTSDLWDRARLLGVRPSQLLPGYGRWQPR